MMRILAIAPYAAFPPVGGGKLRIFHLLEELMLLGHDVTLWYVPADEPELEWSPVGPRPDLRALLARPRASLQSKLASLVSALPEEAWRRPPALPGDLRGSLRSFDVAILMQAHVGRFAAALERYDVPVVLDQQNVEFETSRMVSRLAPNPAMRLRFRLDALKARAFERRLIGRVRLTVAVSAADAAVFRSLAPGAAVVVRPSGADLRTRDFVDHSRARADRLVMTGTLGYLPNLDGANWMFDRILPRLLARRPSIRLSLVGAAAPPSLQGREGVDVAGRVPDVRPYLHAADLFVAPLRAGGGTRLKLLEAFAVGLPVVATSVAAAGLDVADGVHLRIADEAEAFARAVLELLDDVQARSRLAHAARRLVESRYDWRTIARDYERDLLALVASGPRDPNEPAKERALDRRPDRPEERQVHDSGRDEAQQPVEA